jgi:hypothetical protein
MEAVRASGRRIIVEHPDGRRVSVIDEQFDRPEGNPFNVGSDIHEFDANIGQTIIRRRAARPLDDHMSLHEEGFVPVAYIHGDECDDLCTHGPNVILHAADEQCIETVQLADGRTFNVPKRDHEEHLNDPNITIIHPGNEIALEQNDA